MRAEDIVGGCFFALLIPAVAVTISGSQTRLSLRQRALRRGWGLGLTGAALVGFGLLSFALIYNSARPEVEGNLWDVRVQSGGEAELSRFRVTDASGRTVSIRCTYSGPGLVDGERVRVRYVEYSEKLLEMEMLTGSYKGWRLKESPGEVGYWFWVAAGAVCGLFAIREAKEAG